MDKIVLPRRRDDFLDAGRNDLSDAELVGSDPSEQHQNDDDDQNGADKADAAVTVAITVAAETATETSEQKNDKEDDKNES